MNEISSYEIENETNKRGIAMRDLIGIKYLCSDILIRHGILYLNIYCLKTQHIIGVAGFNTNEQN